MPDTELNATSVKLPTFWANNAVAWFAQAEAQFALRKITCDDTQYYYLVAALDSDTAARCSFVLTSPPQTAKYASLKKFLLSAYDLTEDQRAQRLLSMQDLGDRQPSEVMDAMLRLCGDHQPCFLFRQIFLRLLPPSVRQALSTSATTDMRKLAQEADLILRACDATPSHLTVAATGTNQLPDANINRVQGRFSQSFHKRQPPFDRRPNQQGHCCYHSKYGAAARKCLQPCTWVTLPQGNERADPRQ